MERMSRPQQGERNMNGQMQSGRRRSHTVQLGVRREEDGGESE
jgi:hypothetical protein